MSRARRRGGSDAKVQARLAEQARFRIRAARADLARMRSQAERQSARRGHK